jgi:hemolysin activation/secretion protein
MHNVVYRSGLVLLGVLISFGLSQKAFGADIPAQVNPLLLTPVPAPVLLGIPKPVEPVILDKSQVDIGPVDAVDESLAEGMTVETIEWVGKTSLKEGDYRPILERYAGRYVSKEALYQLVNEMTALYHKQGFVTSYTIIPAQDTSQGVLRLEAREGKIGEVTFEGNTRTWDWVVRRNIRTEMRPNDVLNLKTLKSEMTRINKNSPFTLKAEVSTSEQDTDDNDTLPAKIHFDVKEKTSWQVATTLDNQGRPYIGGYRAGISIVNTNLLGMGDRLNLSYVGGIRQFATVNNYTLPLNGRGTELSLNQYYQRVNLDPTKFLSKGQETGGSAYIHWAMLSHPWDRNRVFTSTLAYVTGTARTFSNDELEKGLTVHFGVAGLNFNKPDKYGQTTARIEAAFGKSSTTKWRGVWRVGASATRTLNLPRRNTLIARGAALYTSDVLPVGQNIQIGGAYSVRGYTEALVTGDKGYFFSLEDRFPIPFMKKISPWLDDRVRGTVFFDIGQAFHTRSSPRFVGGRSNHADYNLLMSTGVGLRFRTTQYLMGFVDLGFGLFDREYIEPVAQPSARIHFGIRNEWIPNNHKKSQVISRK